MAGYSVTFTVVDQATAQIEQINRRMRQMREPMERQSKALREFVDLTGLKKVADGFREIGRAGLEAFSSLVRLVPVMGALTGAASIAGLTDLVSGWAKFGQQLTEDATRINTSTQELQNLQDAATLAGGSADDMTASLKGLTAQLSRAQLGDAEAAAWFRKANIALRDTNGNLRTATEVLPEVINYIEGLKDPTDRLRAAQGLGAETLAKLAEQFERSGRTMPQWLAEARKFAPLTDEQNAAVQRYNQAVGELTVAMRHAKESIGAVLGEALTPFIKELGDWVRDNQPQIVAAVRQLATEFAAWIKSIDWNQVKQGANDVLQVLKYLVTHLNLVKDAAEAVAAVFVIKWAAGIVTAIAQVTAALGSTGAISAGATAGGVGLLGALGAVAGVALLIEQIWQHWPEIVDAATGVVKTFGDAWARVKSNVTDVDAMKQGLMGKGPPAPAAPPGQANVPGYGAVPAAPKPPAGAPTVNVPGYGTVPNVPGPMKPGAAATPAPTLGNLLARGESGGNYNIYNRGSAAGGAGHADFAQMTVGELMKRQALPVGDPNRIFAFGKYQVIPETMRGAAKALNLDPSQKVTPELQEKIFSNYLIATKRPDIGKYIRGESNDLAAAEKAASLEWASVADPATGRSHYGGVGGNRASISVAETKLALERSRAQYAQAHAAALTPPQAQGQPAEVTGGPPVSGSVDVTVTHKNPPPGVTVTASGTGDVNVARPRTEQQQLSSPA